MILRFAFRNIRKRPALNLIKITGLGLSLCGILIIGLYLNYELTYDSFHKKSERIYRLTLSGNSYTYGKEFARINNTEYIPGMLNYFPEIETFVRLAPVRGGVIKYNEDYIPVNQGFECDSTFFEVFDAFLLEGNKAEILDNPGSMVVSEDFARRTFGKTNPVGQVLTLPAGQYYGKDINFVIKGIMRDLPGNSHFHPEFITTPVDRSIFQGWAWTYLVLSEKADPEKIIAGFSDFYLTLVSEASDAGLPEAHLQKVTDIHLHSDKLREIEVNGNMYIIYTLLAAALILAVIALANNANLNAGMVYYSEKFLYISKVAGSSTTTTLKYFLTEAMIILTGAVAICAILSFIADSLIRKYLDMSLFQNKTVLISIIVIVFTGLSVLSGIIPVLQKAVVKIKTLKHTGGNNNLRRKGISKGMIVLQYAISTALLISVIVISMQTSFALANGMGGKTNDLICIRDVHTILQQKFEVFKQELLKYNSIEFVSAMFEAPGGEANDMFQFNMEGYTVSERDKTDEKIGIFPCDYSFPRIFGFKFLGGSTFSDINNDIEGSGEYLINRAAMKRLNYTDPDDIVGKKFKLITNIPGIDIPDGRIIGVVEDFHLSSLKKEIEPLVMFKRKDLWLINFVVKFRDGMSVKAISDLKSVWNNMFLEYPMQYNYVGTLYRNIYKPERLQAILLAIFTIMALFICSIGLLGMALLTTQRRTKETGLRKIHGASVMEILYLLNMDILKWILISLIIAFPAAYLSMQKWLGNFAYKIHLSLWIFVLAGMITIITVLVTISVQSWRTANCNPAETLRYE